MEVNNQSKVSWKDSVAIYGIIIALMVTVFLIIQVISYELLGSPIGVWVGLIITEISLAGIVLLWLKFRIKGDLIEIGVQKPEPKWLIISIVFAPVLYFGVVFVLAIQNTLFPPPPGWVEGYGEVLLGQLDPLILIVWSIFMWLVVAPCEEIVFRGLIQTGFGNNWSERGKLVYLAPIITGILFGIFHLDPFRIIPIAVMGVGVSLIYYKSNNSLPTAIVLHAAYNSIPYILLLVLTLLT
ncbi:MAG: type II CAAX prenyl endopeptidase Rce1 family protein [Candidatus Hodarchaeota archaeon]